MPDPQAVRDNVQEVKSQACEMQQGNGKDKMRAQRRARRERGKVTATGGLAKHECRGRKMEAAKGACQNQVNQAVTW